MNSVISVESIVEEIACSGSMQIKGLLLISFEQHQSVVSRNLQEIQVLTLGTPLSTF